MITHLQMVTVWVGDLDRAVEFYTGALGFEKYAEWDGGPGDRIVWVCPEAARPVELATGIGLAEAGPERRPGGPTGFVFTSADVEFTSRELEARGVSFTLDARQPPGEPAGEREARFVDLDGNEFLIHS